ncbi:MAG TPA: isoleucine--tRNA ligase [Actinomycetota bacterium]|nr:isoleucine--tRNA ligase [Actinomycetota bacterium]
MAPPFSPVAPQVRFPEVEQRILAYWARHDIVARGLAQNEGAPEWVFYEGPPTANGRPGVHHVEARIFKDIFPRFQVMRGRYVHRKGGWDCHGLPVELQIEKELGFNRKAQIEEYGIERFNAACRESVLRYVAEWERLTERIGFWINMDEAYLTMRPEYVESVWWSLKALYDAGLLFQDHKSVPYCPRCETALSDHELNYAGSYRTVTDPSVYVRFPLVDGDADLLVWTTTPWTLPSNLAAAVNPEVTYAKVAWGHERPVILAEELVTQVLNEGARIIETFPASELVGKHYTPPFRYVEPDSDAWFVIDEEYVTTTDGTGIVHIAPAFGTEDLEAGRRHGLPFVNLVDRSGHFVPEAGPLAGMWVKDADRVVIEDLSARDLLFKEVAYEHNYPHCWRCGTPLLYYAKSSWFVRTTRFREGLLAQNEQTTWHPEAIKHGRYGDWLANNIDWALSRDRYWGTPLPIWECPENHRTVAGSREDLSKLAGRDLTGLDPHRPFVDEVTFACPECGQEAHRVPEVIDAWYDSGSMPFAQWGYPRTGVETVRRRFPADFICEGLDQTRGWFYSLMAVSTLVFGRSSYKQVLCLGLIVDEDGRKMSKSTGNVLDPWSVLDAQGADALRWYLFTSGSPWANRRLGPGVVEEFLRRYLLTLWNTYSFFVTYANLDGFDPAQVQAVPVTERPELDRWMLAELNDTVAEVTDALESYDALRGGRRLDALVDDLSNWYVRRSRRRFWRSEGLEATDKAAAYATLWECLVTIAQLTAPYTPFIAEEIYTNLTGAGASGGSVHLTSWPAGDPGMVDRDLMDRMRLARQLVALGRAARAKAKLRTRQPLPRALAVVPAAERPGVAQMARLVAEELNVKELELVDSLEELVHYTIKPNFRALGPRFGKRMPAIAAAIAGLSAAELRDMRDELAVGGPTALVMDGETITLDATDLEVRAERREGYEVEHEGGYAVALDTDITPELRAEGLAREVVRAVQDARKEAGLEISDRIRLWLGAAGELAGAIEAHEAWILGEVLGVERLAAAPAGGFSKSVEVEGAPLEVRLAKA